MNFTTNEIAILDALDFSIDELENLDAPTWQAFWDGFVDGVSVAGAIVGAVAAGMAAT